jgi:hypothetical protein
MSVLENLGCKAADNGCDDGDSSVPPSSTTSSPSQPAPANTSPSASPSSSSKPTNAALAKGNNTPTPSSPPTTPTSMPPTTPTSTLHKSSTSPPPAQTSGSGSGSGSGGDVHQGGQYVSWSLFLLIYSLCLPRATFFTQNGVAGACGTVHQDSDLICAMGERSLERLTQ